MSCNMEVNTLFQLSVSSFSHHLISSWFDNINGDGRPKKIVKEKIPCKLSTVVVSEICELFVKKCVEMRVNNHLPKLLSILLDNITIPKLLSLNFSCLLSTGWVQKDVLLDFEASFIMSLPYFDNLVQLSLATHGQSNHLPVCTDDILYHISIYCTNLKSLNISYNRNVTDFGLRQLIPSMMSGCPHLEELFVFECSVTALCVADILNNLPKLCLLGYKEIGNALILLSEQFRVEGVRRVLSLTHINHMGQLATVRSAVHTLRFSCNMMKATASLCPNVQSLKIRVRDGDVEKLKLFSALKSLELVYNIGKPSSPGGGIKNYLNYCGSQLTILSLMCNFFNEQNFKLIGRCCANIEQLWLRCNEISFEFKIEPILVPDKTVFTKLKSLYLRVGETEASECSLPVHILMYILANTLNLTDLKLAVRSESLTDGWLSQLWNSFATDKLEKLFIVLPARNIEEGVISLTMSSVYTILSGCPNLKKLENVLVWNVSYKEWENLKVELHQKGNGVDVTYRNMTFR